MKNKILFLNSLLLVIWGLVFTPSCTQTPTPETGIVRFSLKGNETKTVNLYGQNYTFSINKIEDTRCFLDQFAFYWVGIKVELIVKNQNDSRIIQLTDNYCEDGNNRDLKDTLTFFENAKLNSENIKLANVSNFLLGIFYATPFQKVKTPLITYQPSDYELFLITKK